LLALKIPTIAAGKVEIKKLVRQPGYRSIVGVTPVSGSAFGEPEEVASHCSKVWASAQVGLWRERVEFVDWNIYQPEQMFAQLFSALGVGFSSIELNHNRLIVRVVLANSSPQEIGRLVGKEGFNLKLIKAFSGWSVVF
jgi:transcription antitermination factor NusA-like protein